MEQLDAAERFLRLTTRWIAMIGLVCLVGLTLATIADVLMRWLFNSPIEGVHDLYSLMVAVVVGTFFPVALIERHHITITFLGSAMGTRVNSWLNTLSNVALLLFLVLLSWQLIRYVGELRETGETTWILQWPIAPWWTVTTAVIIYCVPVQLLVTLKDAVSPSAAPGHGHAPPS